MKITERRMLARESARRILRSGVAFQGLTLKAVAADLEWSLGTLHRAYSITGTLLNDLLLEYEDAIYSEVFSVGPGGLEVELKSQAHKMYGALADLANAQMLRYQMALGCRSENPLELPLRYTRDSSWEFSRDILIQISQEAGEEYRDMNALATIVTAFRDGLAYQYFSHGDREMWLRDALAAVQVAVTDAQPRKLVKSEAGGRRWNSELAPPKRPDLVHRPAENRPAENRPAENRPAQTRPAGNRIGSGPGELAEIGMRGL
jgi:hypothetical protein